VRGAVPRCRRLVDHERRSAVDQARPGLLSSEFAAHAARGAALTGGFQRALLACATFLLAAVIALRSTNTRGEPTAPADDIHPGHDRIPAPELTD
jgi:hypothetical protein